MRGLKLMLAAICLSGAAVTLAACDDSDGPAEQLGEKVDEAVQDTKRAVEDAAD